MCSATVFSKKHFKTKIIMWIAVILIFFWLYNYNKMKKATKELHSNDDNTIIPFVVVMCTDNKESKTTQHLQKVKILLKSAAAITKVTLKFIIFTDSETIYEKILSPIQLWPQEYQRRLQIDFKLVRYPDNRSAFRALLKPCATFRLFLPELLQQTDAVVYLDTDILFLQPPEGLFEEFKKFNNEEAGSLAECTNYSPGMFGFPYPGKGGFNSGVFLMNLTRLRSAPGGGFTRASMEIYQQYKDKIKYGDQCIINIFFFEHPELLRELGCELHYHLGHCDEGRNSCLEAEKRGALLIHGCARSFTEKKGSFKDIYEVWDEYQLSQPIQVLVDKIKGLIVYYKAKYKGNQKYPLCTNMNNMETIFIKKLSLYTN